MELESISKINILLLYLTVINVPSESYEHYYLNHLWLGRVAS